MEVFLQDCTGGPRAHATKLYSDFFVPLLDHQTARGGGQPTNQPDDDDDDDGCCRFFFPNRKQIFLNIIIIHLLHSHIHCDLDHSCSILTLHDLNFFFPPRNENFPPLREIFSHLHRWQHCYFQISCRMGRSHVTREVEGLISFLKKSLPPLGLTSPYTTYVFYRRFTRL